MATVTHYIYSHYTPPTPKKDADIVETEDVDEESEIDHAWETEFAFGVGRRAKATPRFVRAVVSYAEVNDMLGGCSSAVSPDEVIPPPSSDLADWYKSLPRSSSIPDVTPRDTPFPTSIPPTALLPPPPPPPPEQRTRNNWFVSRALSSEPGPSTARSVPTMADILAREPPPEPSEQSFSPPVFLAIGPSNRGFAMLQQRGWSEGEVLGAGVPRRRPLAQLPGMGDRKGKHREVKYEEREISLDDDDEIREVQRVEVVDLTLSDGEDEAVSETTPAPVPSRPSHNPTALVTPIATVLKSDRLGIGLKAKTEGPYRQSKKRVTHNAAALAAHVKANEEMRMRKALLGRGTRAFARVAKAEAESRKRLLASLNAD